MKEKKLVKTSSEEIGEKRKVLDEIFQKLKKEKPKDVVLFFNNNLIKEISANRFKNQFDVTKCDTPKLLPNSVSSKGFFIVHLGGGNHAFVQGKGYHYFEPIKDVKKWKIALSVIDSISDSEAQSASTVFNNNIIHDFLFDTIDINLQLHTARRAKIDYNFEIGNNILKAKALQIELDGIYESIEKETIATIEVKNKDNTCFEIRQVFSVMKYCEQKLPKNYKIRFLFLVRIRNKEKDIFNIYEYRFIDNKKLESISLVKARSYEIEK